MNYLKNLDDTHMEYPLVPNDDLVRFWRSRLQQAVEAVKAST